MTDRERSQPPEFGHGVERVTGRPAFERPVDTVLFQRLVACIPLLRERLIGNGLELTAAGKRVGIATT